MIYVALFLLSSLWFVSLAIDMGKLSATRTELQRAADAAALAGASAIDKQNGGTIIQDLARARAAATAAGNTALRERSESVVIDPDADVTFPDPANHQVRVVVHRDAASGNAMTTIFARAIGITSLDVAAHAVAEAVPVTELCRHVLPFAPVVVAGGYSTACGTSYTLHTDPASSTGGNFQLLSYPSCPTGPCAGVGAAGGAQIRCLMANGYDCCVDIGATFADTKPGGTVGPVRQGLQARWDGDTDRRSDICYQDYTGNGNRVMPVPIVQTFQLSGRTNATITGFAGFFMLSRPSGGASNMNIVGQFIDYVQPGVAGSNPPPPNAIYTVRLVE
jgi:Flp pilus assembly protein TadG